MLRAYLNQTVSWTPALRGPDGSVVTDNRGEIQYGGAQVISCRREVAVRDLLTPAEQVTRTAETYYITFPVRVDDLLGGRRVQAVEELTGLSGGAIGYIAVV